MAKKAKKTPKIAGKQIRKQVKGLRSEVRGVKRSVAKEFTQAKKGLSRSIKTQTKSIFKQNVAIKAELDKLAKELKQKKVPKKELSMYNLFMRQQIQRGQRFEDAAKSWKNSKRILDNPELAKAKTKIRTKIKTRTIVRNVPVVKVRRVTKKVPDTKGLEELKKQITGLKQTSVSPTQITNMKSQLHALKEEMSDMEKEMKPRTSKSNGNSKTMLMKVKEIPDEEVATQLVRLYFEEIARLGFKRRLDLDAIINAYFYCMQRLSKKEKEMEIMKAIVEREEAKLVTEKKMEMIPGMEPPIR